MSASRPATAAMIMIVRAHLTNQERLDSPMTETEAWTLFRESHLLDMQRLAVHRLFDLAIAAKDGPKLDLVITALEVELCHVCCSGLLRRIVRQHVCQGWQKWASEHLRKGTLPISPVPESLVA